MPFYLVLEQAQIHNKQEFWFFPAEVRFYSFVTNKALSLPDLDILISAQDPAKLRNQVRELAKDVLNQWEGIKVEGVDADHIFKFGDTGKVVYRSDDVPDRVDWILLAIEDDQETRDFGAMIDEILPDDKADSLAGNLLKIASKSASPQVTAAIAISKALLRGITHVLQSNENDQLGLVEQSFIRELHYPKGHRYGIAVQDLTGNMWYDYTIFAKEV